jgi:hypothetical protein
MYLPTRRGGGAISSNNIQHRPIGRKKITTALASIRSLASRRQLWRESQYRGLFDLLFRPWHKVYVPDQHGTGGMRDEHVGRVAVNS